MPSRFWAPKYRPSLEILEGRALPAVVVQIGIDLDNDGNFDDARITGDAGNNAISILDDGTTLLFDLDKNNDGDFADSTEFQDTPLAVTDGSTVIEFKGGDGDDVFSYAPSADLNLDQRVLAADLGAGNDFFGVNSFQNLTNSSALLVDVVGGKGNDFMRFVLVGVQSSLAAVQAQMGGGADTMEFDIRSVDQGGRVTAALDLGGGANEGIFDITNVGVTSQGQVDIDMIGSNTATKADDLTVSVLGTVGNGTNVSSVSIQVDLLAGNDLFTTSLFHNAFAVAGHSSVQVAARGGAGNDVLRVLDAQTIPGGSMNLALLSVLAIDLNGGAGLDTMLVDFFAADALELDGEFRLRLAGIDGNDTITTNLRNTATSSGSYDIVVQAGTGNDTVNFDVETSGSPVAFGPAGAVLLNGGLGSDTLGDADPSLTNSFSFEAVLP